jgi:hypothetical protein
MPSVSVLRSPDEVPVELRTEPEEVVEGRHAFAGAAVAGVEPCACRHVELEVGVVEEPPAHALAVDPQHRPSVDQQRGDDAAGMVAAERRAGRCE